MQTIGIPDMDMWTKAILILAAGSVVGCDGDDESAAGYETGPCVMGECLGGFECISDVCVDRDSGGSADAGSGAASGDGDGDPSAGDGDSGDGDGDSGDGDGDSTGSGTSGGSDPDPGNPGEACPLGDRSCTGFTYCHPTDGVCTSGCVDDKQCNPGWVCDRQSKSCVDPVNCGGGGTRAPGETCDLYGQNCDGCHECSPDQNFTEARCIPAYGDREIGEGCTNTFENGQDSCVRGAKCIANPNAFSMCVEMCGGSPSQPVCLTPDTFCVNLGDFQPACLTRCDPRPVIPGFGGNGCEDGWGCYHASDTFGCYPEVGGVPHLQPCSYFNDCLAGSFCGADGTCHRYCRTTEVTCNCVPWDWIGTPDPELDDLGYCE